jgi:hypothetical protein
LYARADVELLVVRHGDDCEIWKGETAVAVLGVAEVDIKGAVAAGLARARRKAIAAQVFRRSISPSLACSRSN